ncbi:hypothetical protein EDD17DRAFT_1477767 [Pisolithus thermaeus]|nr:hypothetical protein EV401DRAFT_1880013 [Pisolithus croceorrhizus]KAI6162745.1 hypothetical protein EDD17DRAFT_1477767 [Pisolithus thermaeus]
MSATMVFGFFVLANRDHVRTFRPGSSTMTYHCIYETTIQCTSGIIFPAMLCTYSPFNNMALPDNTVAFVSAKVCMPVTTPDDPMLLEGICVIAVPSDPATNSYESGIPDFPHLMVMGLGSVVSPTRTLADSTSKAFDIISSDYVWDTRMTSTVWYVVWHHLLRSIDIYIYSCVFNSAHPWWSKTPVLNQNVIVFYVGHFSNAASAGGLQVELESITLNIGMESRPSIGTLASPASRKHKFMAVAPREGYVCLLCELLYSYMH